jgi:HD-like signal output (HDOD) protein
MIETSGTREALLHVVKNLRTAPAVLAQLGGLLLFADLDLADVIVLLKRDPALTSRIIRVSNSVIYGSGQRIGSLEEALARVGFNEVYRLTALAAMVEFTDQDVPLYGITAAQFRENALFNALVMERLAAAAHLAPSEAYTTGLLRAVGKIALDRTAPAGVQRAPYSPGRHGPVAEWEREQMGMTSCEAAAMVLEHWRFPRGTVEAIQSQYVSVVHGCTMGFLLHGSLAATGHAGYGLPGEQWYWTTHAQKLAAAGCTEEDLAAAASGAAEVFASARALVV